MNQLVKFLQTLARPRWFLGARKGFRCGATKRDPGFDPRASVLTLHERDIERRRNTSSRPTSTFNDLPGNSQSNKKTLIAQVAFRSHIHGATHNLKQLVHKIT